MFNGLLQLKTVPYAEDCKEQVKTASLRTDNHSMRRRMQASYCLSLRLWQPNPGSTEKTAAPRQRFPTVLSQSARTTSYSWSGLPDQAGGRYESPVHRQAGLLAHGDPVRAPSRFPSDICADQAVYSDEFAQAFHLFPYYPQPMQRHLPVCFQLEYPNLTTKQMPVQAVPSLFRIRQKAGGFLRFPAAGPDAVGCGILKMPPFGSDSFQAGLRGHPVERFRSRRHPGCIDG